MVWSFRLWLLEPTDPSVLAIVAVVVVLNNIGLGAAALLLSRVRLPYLVPAFVSLLVLLNFVGYRLDLHCRPTYWIPMADQELAPATR